MGKYTDALNALKSTQKPKSLVPLATPTTLQRRFEGLDLQPTTVVYLVVCPACSHKNVQGRTECENCGAPYDPCVLENRFSP